MWLCCAGINVGGKAKLPMGELRGIFAACGATAVETYIQSGNVVFEAARPEDVVAAVTAEIARAYGYPGRIVLRSGVEMVAAIEGNPFAGARPRRCMFTSWRTGRLRGLNSMRAGRRGTRLRLWGVRFISNLPGGMARTKLTNAWFDGKLGTLSTARNWRTVGVLAGHGCWLTKERHVD